MFLPTNKEIYNSAISRANELTLKSIDDFTDLVVQLSLSKEFSDIGDLFNVGDELKFSVGDFLESKDQNVVSIIKILNSLKNFDTLQNPT